MRPEFCVSIFIGITAFVSCAPLVQAEICQQRAPTRLDTFSQDCITSMLSLTGDDFVLPTADAVASPKGAGSIDHSVSGIVVAPVVVENSSAGVSLRASLTTLRDYAAQIAAAKVVELRALAPANLPLPRSPVVANSPVEVWSKVNVQGYDSAGDPGARAGLGVDYRFDRDVSAGVAAERGDVKTPSIPGTQSYDKVDAHINYQVTQMLSVNSRAQWEAGNADFAAVNGSPDKRSVSVAPKISKTFALDYGQSVVPFVTYTRELDFEGQILNGTIRSSSTAQSAGAGVSFEKRDAYSLSITTEIGSLGSAESAAINSRVQLTIPIR